MAQPFTTIINVPPDVAPSEIGSDTQLNLFDGGSIGTLRAGDFNGTSTNVEVNITGGTAHAIWAYSGSTLNIENGELDDFYTNNGSTSYITGGSIDNLLQAAPDSSVTIWGGKYRMIRATIGSTLNLHGGSIYGSLISSAGSRTSLFGGDFRLNGVQISGLISAGDMATFTLPSESVLTGILEDGTVFIAENQNRCSECHYDDLTGSTLVNASTPPINQQIINDPSQLGQWGLRAGQTLNLTTGSVIGDGFNAVSSEINLSGGTIKDYLKIVDTTLNISSGIVGGSFEAFSNSIVNVRGGSFGVSQSGSEFTPELHRGVVLNQTGGSINAVFAYDGSIANLSGGTRRTFLADFGSLVNISGGAPSTSGRYFAFAGSTTNFIGASFILNGIDITSELTLDEVHLISERDVTLEGVYADGSQFSISLSSSRFRTDAIVTITLVPEPGTLCLVGLGALCTLRR